MIVLSNCANHGDHLLHEPLTEFIRREEIVTHDITPQSICHIKHNPLPWFSTPSLVSFPE